MTEISNRCLVSGTGGYVTITPGGRVVLTESVSPVRGGDLDRIADEVGVDVALRTLAAAGAGTVLLETAEAPYTITMSGRVGALIELPTANLFVTPTGTDAHTMRIPGNALRFAVGIGAGGAADLSMNTAASISTPDGQVAGQFVIDLRVAAEPDPTPVGLDVVDLSAAADFTPAPLPVVSQQIQPPPPEVAAPPAAAPQPVASAPAAPAPAPTPAPAPAPAPAVAESDEHLVLGIRCPLNHHNHPDAGYCAQCGRKMGINATAVLTRGPRPPLGLFLLDDGGAIPIATDLLIGRDATTHPDVMAGTRQAVLLNDTSNVVSRHHLAITLQEWTVTVADLGSANGTVLVNAHTGQATPLIPHTPVSLDAGDRLQIGPRSLQLELHHVATPQ